MKTLEEKFGQAFDDGKLEISTEFSKQIEVALKAKKIPYEKFTDKMNNMIILKTRIYEISVMKTKNGIYCIDFQGDNWEVSTSIKAIVKRIDGFLNAISKM
jgi:hypothetical protein